jgi:adenylate cyclase
VVAALAVLALLAAALWLASLRRARQLAARLRATEAELQHLQQSCAMLAPPAVVQRVMAEGLSSMAERKQVTVLFVDVVGYTALAERLEPASLTEVLNGYYQRVSDAVTARRGRIATFLGDGVLAYFGAFEPNPWQCDDAVAAALTLVDAMRAYDVELAARGLAGLAVGIGIHRGTGIAGLVGTRDRMEYAFIGRTVNLAARVQALTRVHGCPILITDAVREALDPRVRLRALPAVEVKGVAEPIVVHAVLGLADAPQAAQRTT